MALLCALAACGSTDAPADVAEGPGGPTSTNATESRPPPESTTTTTVASPSTTATGVEVALRIEDRTGTAPELASVVQAALLDERGWQQAGFRFVFRDDAPNLIVLAEPGEVDERCAPYDTDGQWSCQLGPEVLLNVDRWRSATATWPGSIEDYRTMLVNHEVGHLLGQHHVQERCPTAGAFAPVMAQQSKGLAGCAANPWPLPWEVACAARHEEPLSPGYEPDASPTCGPT